jgi:hypothetical protein
MFLEVKLRLCLHAFDRRMDTNRQHASSTQTAFSDRVAWTYLIYIIGGHKLTRRSCIKKVCKDVTVDQFNPVTEEWISVGDLNQARASHATFVHRGVLGVMGGHCNAPPLPTRSGHGRHATTFGEM